MKKEKLILGIETSCDDTSIAIIKEESNKVEVLAHLKQGQEDLLTKWGGVVPEISARNHLAYLSPLIKEAYETAKIELKEIDLIAVTTVPGLLGPLLTGLNTAKTLSLLLKKPVIAVNHLYAHLEAIHLTDKLNYPYLGLLISGGHSIFFWVKSPNEFQVLGSTIDDAAGEAFDKGGKILGLGYPAGHIIDKLAKHGNDSKIEFPIGLQSSADARLSFSGLKTALKNYVDKNSSIMELKPKNFEIFESRSQDFYDVCASYQGAISKALLLKLRYAIKKVEHQTNSKFNSPIVVGGGVACNSYLREVLNKKYKNVRFVAPEYCTDNGAMIANFGRINMPQAIPFPNSLNLDARGRFIDKKEFINVKTS